eukprot:GILI01019471.1.p1 GENE.GILI01019471.1~~GILI01019471.1.p1  ORF type:complete len:345 (+),score=69.85 GILI01019471.1:69-1037(+)
MIQVLPNIFIGSIESSQDLTALRANNITHIAAVGAGLACPFPDSFKYYQADILDEEEADLIAILPDALKFLQECLASNGSVLVHCVAGQSRSASVIAAHIMSSQGVSASEALALIKRAHTSAAPNSGFMEQLDLFSEMGFEIQGASEAHKKYRIIRAQNQRNMTGSVSNSLLASAGSSGIIYSCSKCRQRLFTSDNLVTHSPAPDRIVKEFAGKNIKDRRPKTTSANCTSHFIEAMDWMTGLHDVEGKIMCPNSKCAQRLGHWHWSGAQCSCGEWVAPAFQLHKSRVDFRAAGPVMATPVLPFIVAPASTVLSSSSTSGAEK